MTGVAPRVQSDARRHRRVTPSLLTRQFAPRSVAEKA
ncbi:hypothetical protein J2S44_003039 [Catenuloplanes niger]|uniref:Uncharacterized protein n=1 Tax=Catenuloplanes niger TaxID=587534 RepID=A0AAE3ZMP4_9ACTN|nr:hypothetical protein [Catenuloplanes niger]